MVSFLPVVGAEAAEGRAGGKAERDQEDLIQERCPRPEKYSVLPVTQRRGAVSLCLQRHWLIPGAGQMRSFLKSSKGVEIWRYNSIVNCLREEFIQPLISLNQEHGRMSCSTILMNSRG